MPKTSLNQYSIYNRKLICGNHLFIREDNLARSISNYSRVPLNREKLLYNLLTSKGTLVINDIECHDFNGNIEVILEN